MDIFVVGDDGYPHIEKDKDAKIPYTWNWTLWLAKVGGTSLTASLTAASGISLSGGANITGGKVTQFVSGGTAGSSYKVACKVTADNGAIDERTIVIDVVER